MGRGVMWGQPPSAVRRAQLAFAFSSWRVGIRSAFSSVKQLLGLKPESLCALYAALEAPLFHGRCTHYQGSSRPTCTFRRNYAESTPLKLRSYFFPRSASTTRS